MKRAAIRGKKSLTEKRGGFPLFSDLLGISALGVGATATCCLHGFLSSQPGKFQPQCAMRTLI